MNTINSGAASSLINSNNTAPQSQQQIASGRRINSAADDAAGLAIATRLSSQINGNQQAQQNAINAQSLIQTEDGALQGISAGLERLQEIAVQQGNGILSDSDRQALTSEAQQITDQIRQTTEQSQFNGRAVFQSDNLQNSSLQNTRETAGFEFQVGEDAGDSLSLSANTLADGLNQALSEIDFSSADSADTLDTLSGLQQQISGRQTELGAVSNRLDASINNLTQSNENSQAARSRIEDADLATSVSELIRGQIQQQAQIATQLQANAGAENVLRLLS